MANTLGYAGLFPLAIAWLLSLFAEGNIALLAELAFVSYSAIILSFLCGALWGQALQGEAEQAGPLQQSNIVAVLAWLVLLGFWCGLLTAIWALLLLATGYLVLWWMEYMAVIHQQRPGYRQLRGRLTAAVVALHLLMLLA
ncbi:DUF3429 domain-containing protein [Aliagarivorans taiwanensis]|uniref:DUF3429 domain-containing protein n=1 Tax=Aliagarivorans taiwanensis TaxID=561966 RepID=UPI0003F7CECB|nr:DUF3429 domain-containing protein [Aliagarivorans taiwanensis]